MRLFLRVAGTLLVVGGTIWILQGFNLLPGQSFMNGSRQWAVNGAIAAAVGVGLLVASGRIGRRGSGV